MKITKLITLFMSAFLMFSCAHAERTEIKAIDIIKLLKKGEPVQIVNKIILGDLNFTEAAKPFIVNTNLLQTEIVSNILFSNCVFMDKVTSNGTLASSAIESRFRNNLVFFGCDFRSEVDFTNVTVFGTMDFRKSIFRENTNFNNISVWAKDSYFSQVSAEKKFTMEYASFFGNLYFLNATFAEILSLQEISIKGKLSFNNASFKKNVDFSLMSIDNRAFFNYTTFDENVNFSLSKFSNTTDFINASFLKNAIFDKTYFSNTVRLNDIKSSAELDFSNAIFVVNKPQSKQ